MDSPIRMRPKVAVRSLPVWVGRNLPKLCCTGCNTTAMHVAEPAVANAYHAYPSGPNQRANNDNETSDNAPDALRATTYNALAPTLNADTWGQRVESLEPSQFVSHFVRGNHIA